MPETRGGQGEFLETTWVRGMSMEMVWMDIDPYYCDSSALLSLPGALGLSRGLCGTSVGLQDPLAASGDSYGQGR